MPADRWLARIGADVLLDESSKCGLTHIVFPVDAGVDQPVDIAGLSSCLLKAGSGGGIGEAARRGRWTGEDEVSSKEIRQSSRVSSSGVR